MKLSLKEKLGYSIETYDQVTGKIKDFLFDDEQWIIRYVDADLGYFLSERRVLIPQTFLEKADWITQNFKVNLSKEGLSNCPPLDNFLPISRMYEEELNRHYRLPNYWARMYKEPRNGFDKMPHVKLTKEKFNARPEPIIEKQIDSNLRSFGEIIGYDILTSDGILGCVDDLLIESNDWGIISIIVDMSKSQSQSKKVIIASTWIEEVSYAERQIKILLPTKEVESAPEYDPLEPINEELEKRYYNYLGKPIK